LKRARTVIPTKSVPDRQHGHRQFQGEQFCSDTAESARPTFKIERIDVFCLEEIMSVARVTELISASTKSFEDAIQVGVSRAAKTLENVESVWVAN
jgi:Dodecin